MKRPTAKQKERVFKAAMRWFTAHDDYPVSAFYDSKNLTRLQKACAAARNK